MCSVRISPVTIGVVRVKAVATILIATVGTGIDMVGAELLFAIEARFAGLNIAHGTERNDDCVMRRVGKRCADEHARRVGGRDARGRLGTGGKQSVQEMIIAALAGAWDDE